MYFRCVLPEYFFFEAFFVDLSFWSLPSFILWDVAPSILFPLREVIRPILSLESQLGQLGSKTFSPPFSKGLGFCLWCICNYDGHTVFLCGNTLAKLLGSHTLPF
jgi:hypothetical protein